MSKKTAVNQWIDDRLKADRRLAHVVDPILSEMRLEQDLIDGLDGGLDADAAASWGREISRRLNALDAGKVRTVPWTEVKRRLQVRLRGTRQR